MDPRLDAAVLPWDALVIIADEEPSAEVLAALPTELPHLMVRPGCDGVPRSFFASKVAAQKHVLAQRLKVAGVHRPLLCGLTPQAEGIFAASREVFRVFRGAPGNVVADAVWDPSTNFPVERVRQALARRRATRPSVLVLYSDNATHIGAVADHVRSLREHSRHDVYFASATRFAPCPFDLSDFQAIVVHYSVRMCVKDYFSPHFRAKLEAYLGPKLLFIQDEYDRTEISRQSMEQIGFDTVFTCVPDESVHLVYPPERFPGVRFVGNLTGYVPEEFKYLPEPPRLEHRSITIGYRGRMLPFWYGSLGREKVEIAMRMRAICDERGLSCDIEWNDDKRIYGDDWYGFIASCRVMLATESGANVFDDDGSIRANIERDLKADPNFSYEQARGYFDQLDGQIRMNQVSPRIFETIAWRTGLVLYEGEYSGVLQPDVHYIALKKDFSNIEEVLEKVADVAFVQQLVDRAYQDVILSERWSYRSFVAMVDAEIERLVPAGRRAGLVLSAVGKREDTGGLAMFRITTSNRHLPSVALFSSRNDGPAESDGSVGVRYREETRRRLSAAADKLELRQFWRQLPDGVKDAGRPILKWLRARF